MKLTRGVFKLNKTQKLQDYNLKQKSIINAKFMKIKLHNRGLNMKINFKIKKTRMGMKQKNKNVNIRRLLKSN